jgi:hypothetical protein
VDADITQQSREDLYGTSPPHEKDWYAGNQPYVVSPIQPNNYTFTLYLSIKRRTYWYLWKIHYTEYNNYKDFKQAWNPKNSVRKEIINDIKNVFNKRK